jgi:ABC-type lipoprotein export system ATPase subunit
LEDVAKRYGGVAEAASVAVLEGINLVVNPGESVAIVGPSGSGKSTLLHLIGTLDKPTSGRILVDGQDVSRLEDRGLAEFRNRRIGFIFQAHYLLPQCTVWENVLVPTLASRAPSRGCKSGERAGRLLERVGLGGRLEHFPGQLSGGERQRVAVVRALINTPRLLLADEPTGALDHTAAAALGQLLVQLNREEHIALIVVTHALDLAARMDRTLELRDGRLRARSAGCA